MGAIYKNANKSAFLKNKAIFNIKIDSAVYKNDNVRNVLLNLETGENKLTISDLKASLPNNSELVSNFVVNPSEQTVDGKVNFLSDNFSAFIKWLGLPALSPEKNPFAETALSFDLKLLKQKLN